MRTPLCGADLSFAAGADVVLAVEEGFEYGIFVVAGAVVAESTTVGVDSAALSRYQPTKPPHSKPARRPRDHARRRAFAEDIVMWWNFIGRSHQEIV